jgi:hypothetical protein
MLEKCLTTKLFIWIKQWADKCSTVTPIDSNYDLDERIEYYLDAAIDSGYFPPSFDKLATYQWKMVGGIDLHELISHKIHHPRRVSSIF